MKNALILIFALGLVACAPEQRLTVINNTDRVVELERLAALNLQVDALQAQEITALQASLDAEKAAREQGDLNLSVDLQAEMDARIAEDAVLANLIAQEEAARIAGDDGLRADLQMEIADRIAEDAVLASLIAQEEAARIAGDSNLSSQLQSEIAARIAGDKKNAKALRKAVRKQALINQSVQNQLSRIKNKIQNLRSRLSSLMSRVSSLEGGLGSLEAEVAQLAIDSSSSDALLQAQIDDLSHDLAAAQEQIDEQGVQVYKCGSSSSTERILKINGKFYAVMNRITKKTVQVVTGSSSQSFTTPDMCETYSGDLKLPNSGGVCTPVSGPFKSTKVSGQTIVVPSYTTANATLVDSVKIALDILVDGVYTTTDGGPACSFSISGGGTVSTNLIPVQ